ncbi:MAG: hypothetical protein KatS3mg105_1165 [Gemmatales bacterium]|nr:MAG: hypothetical protein KatS3mg105_1165 [Gemmatales bacterium]
MADVVGVCGVITSEEPIKEQPGDPCIMVIFGASGDLTKRLLMPALFNLACDRLLPDCFAIVGMALDDMTTETFRQRMTNDIKQFNTRKQFDEGVWNEFVKKLYYTPGRFDDAAAFQKLLELVTKLDGELGTQGNVLFLHGDAAGRLRHDLRRYRSLRLQETARLETDHCRETVRHGPPLRHRAEPDPFEVLDRRPDLSDRPLPWQRDGAESVSFSFLPTASSNLCGTSAMWIISSSPSRNRWAWKGEAITTIAPAFCAT